jgi:hypothetical protein
MNNTKTNSIESESASGPANLNAERKIKRVESESASGPASPNAERKIIGKDLYVGDVAIKLDEKIKTNPISDEQKNENNSAFNENGMDVNNNNKKLEKINNDKNEKKENNIKITEKFENTKNNSKIGGEVKIEGYSRVENSLLLDESCSSLGWEQALEMATNMDDDRYDCDDEYKTKDSYDCGNLSNVMDLPHFKKIIDVVPEFLTLIPVNGDKDLGFTLQSDFRFGPGNVPLYIKDDYLCEKKEYSVFRPSLGREMVLPCCGMGDKYECHLTEEFLEVSRNRSELSSKHKQVLTQYGGKDPHSVYTMLRGMAGFGDAGDNHIAYLTNMLRYYFSNVVGEAFQLTPSGRFMITSNMYDCATDITSYVTYSRARNTAHVFCAERNQDMHHFLLCCGQSGKSLYTVRDTKRPSLVSVYDDLDIQFDKNILVISQFDFDYDNVVYRPQWVGDKTLIKSYIMYYVDSLSLHQQLNEALNNIRVVPYMLESGLSLCLPKMFHVTDLCNMFIDVNSIGQDHFGKIRDESAFECYFSERLLFETLRSSVMTFCEGALHERNTLRVSSFDKNFVMSRLLQYRHRQDATILNLFKLISGYDLFTLRQMRGGTAFRQWIAICMMGVDNSTLGRMLVNQPITGSWCAAMRKSTIYHGTEKSGNRYIDDRNTVDLLNMLNFGNDSIDISKKWNVKPKSQTDRTALAVNNRDKSVWLHSIRGEPSRLRLWRVFFSMGEVPTYSKPVDDDAEWETTLKDLFDGNTSRAYRYQEYSDENKDNESKAMLSNQFLGDDSEVVSDTQDSGHGHIAEKLQAEATMLRGIVDKGKSDKYDYVVKNKNVQDLRDRYHSIDSYHDSILPSSTELLSSASRIWKRSELTRVSVDSGEIKAFMDNVEGACGIQAYVASAVLGSSNIKFPPHLNTISKIRAAVEREIGLDHLSGEWWQIGHLCAIGKIMDVTVLYKGKSGKMVEYGIAYKGTVGIVYVENNGGDHWVPYISGPAVRGDLAVSKKRMSLIEDSNKLLITEKFKIEQFHDSKKSAEGKHRIVRFAPDGTKDVGKENEEEVIVDKLGCVDDYIRNSITTLKTMSYGKGKTFNNLKTLDKINSKNTHTASGVTSITGLGPNKIGEAKKLAMEDLKKEEIPLLVEYAKSVDYVKNVLKNPHIDLEVVLKARRSVYDLKKYSKMEISEYKDNSEEARYGCRDICPKWIYLFKRIMNRRATWECLEKLYAMNMFDSVYMRIWYSLLFPDLQIPKKYCENKSVGFFNPEGCKGLGCSMKARDFRCGGASCVDECKMGDEILPEQRLGKEYVQILPNQLGQHVSDSSWSKLNKVFPFYNNIGAQKTNMDLGSLVKMLYQNIYCKYEWMLIKRILLNRVGDRNHLIVAILIFCFMVDHDGEAYALIHKLKILGTCTRHWIEHFNVAHQEIRANSTYDGENIGTRNQSRFMYLHLLYGRLGKEVDWEKEKDKRTAVKKPIVAWDGKTWSRSLARKLAIAEMKNIFKKMKVPRGETLENRFRRRHEWVVSGAATKRGKVLDSITGTKLAQETVNSGDLHANKRSYSEKMTYSEVTNMLKRSPVQLAYGHTKGNELAKTRAIFGVDLDHYYLHSYICEPVERAFKADDMRLKEKIGQGLEDILTRQKWAKKGRNINCFDFSDFNAQHALETMYDLHMVMKSWYEKSLRCDGKSDYIQVCDWIAKSFLKSVYYTKNNRVEVTSGMFSGNRGTTIINTILNRVYMKIVERSYKKLYRYAPVISTFRTGDDIIQCMKSTADNYLYSIFATEHNLEANRQKLMQDKGKGEYLRLMYNPDGTVLGSLCRSLGTFINGNWESEANRDGIARSQAIWEQISVLVRRGLRTRMGDLICANCVTYFSRTIHRGWITEPLHRKFLQTSVKDGGLGLPSYVDGIIYRCKVPFSRKQDKRRLHGSDLGINLNASNDYIKYLNRELLPRDGTIRSDERKGALDILSASTIGLELPPSKNILNMSKKEVEAINNVCKIENNFYEEPIEISDGRVVTAKMLISGIRRAKSLSSNLEYYDKMKQVVELLVGHTSREKDNILRVLMKGKEIVPGFDTKVDRHDRGLLPPDVVGTAKLFSLSKTISYSDVVKGVEHNSVLCQLAY